MPQGRRETQALLATTRFVFRAPSLVALEILWRWAFGIPVLWWAWRTAQALWDTVPLALIAQAQPALANPLRAGDKVLQIALLLWPSLLALAQRNAAWLVLGWLAVSTAGRVLVTLRLKSLRPELPAAITLRAILRLAGFQLARLLLLGAVFALFFRIAISAAYDAFPPGGDPNPVLYLSEVVIAALLLFTAWGAGSYILSVAPAVALARPQLSIPAILRHAAAIRGAIEVNLVLGIVKLALIVLAMVFSAVPMPFEAEVPPEQLHLWWALVTVWYLAASDFFHVARFVEMLRLAAPPDSVN